MEKTISTIPKNSREELRIALTEFNGHQLADLRIYVAGDDPKPTKKGVTVNVALLPELVAALQAAEAEARAAGLLGAEAAA